MSHAFAQKLFQETKLSSSVFVKQLQLQAIWRRHQIKTCFIHDFNQLLLLIHE